MSHLACPTCRQFVSDEALDVGACPFCGHDGPMIAVASPKRAWLLATVAVVLCGGIAGAYLLVPWTEAAWNRGRESAAVKPPPAHPTQPVPSTPEVAPPPRSAGPKLPSSPPTTVAPPRKNPWNPRPVAAGPVERIDARTVRDKRIDAPEGTVSISDMNRDDRLTLSGVVRQLRIGSVGGGATLDASGLSAQEIIVTGDLSGRATVMLNAPGGTVTIGGHVEGRARLVANAPRGVVLVQAGSGKLDGDAELRVIARNVEVGGPLTGNAKLFVTLTGGGSVITGPVQENASVVYMPPPQR